MRKDDRSSQFTIHRRKICRIAGGVVLGCLMFTSVSCAQETKKREAPAAAPAEAAQQANSELPTPNSELVYLKVDSAKVSSFDETPDWAPKPDTMAPFDGDMETRWSSGYSDNEWICADFGKPKTVSRVLAKWEQAYSTKFELLASDDEHNWRSLAVVDNPAGGESVTDLAPVTCRYLKLSSLSRVNDEWGISMWELEIYGPKDKNPSDTAKVGVFKPTKEKSEAEKRREELLGSIGGSTVPSPGALTADEFQKGVNYTSWDVSELGKDISDYSLMYLKDIGVKHVAIMVVWYSKDAVSKTIAPDPKKTISDEALIHAINVCHALGMKVMLKPHVDLYDEDARINIIPNDEWFASYTEFIKYYADLSGKNNVELLCIGTELSNTITSRWKENWLKVIGVIRQLYKGKITYAANWDEYDSVSFWPELDFIGIDAYFPLTEKANPPKEELVAAWKKHADAIEAWRKANNLTQPVIFTEIGYDTIEGSNKQPWRVIPTLVTHKESQDEQANCLESIFLALKDRAWFKGFYWWNYFPRSDLGTVGYTLRGKKGEKVLTEWFGKLK